VPEVKYVQAGLRQVMGQVLQPCEIPFAVDLWTCGELPWNKQNHFWCQALPNNKKAEMNKKYTKEREGRSEAHGNISHGCQERKGCQYSTWDGWRSVGVTGHIYAHRCGESELAVPKGASAG